MPRLGLAGADSDELPARPPGAGGDRRRRLVMNVGSPATSALANPTNLAISCIDNGHHGEAGYQRTHTYYGADLATVALGCGIPTAMTVRRAEEIPAGARLLRQPGPTFVLLRIAPTEPLKFLRTFNEIERRIRFRTAQSAV